MSEDTRAFYGRMLPGGKPMMDDPEGFQRWKESLDGRFIMVRVQERPFLDDISKCRGYFHGVVVPHIAKSVGYEPTQENHARVKDGLKRRFLTIPTTPGEPEQVRSTESLKVKEYSDFIFHCCNYAAVDQHDPVPDPTS